MNERSPLTPRQRELKNEFDAAQHWLLRAIHSGSVASEETLAMLRDRVATAQARRRDEGLEVETFYESSQRQRAEREAQTHQYAEQQKKIKPIVSRTARFWISAAGGALVAILTADIHPAVPVVGGLITCGLIQFYLAAWFPTAGFRVGYRAMANDVAYLKFWPEGSPDQKDFDLACRHYRVKNGRRGWIRVQ